ncbi:MAG: hypothetical protein IT446_02470 [Phycisphaerales bacterium]|nr:hypothetical protein [Phycisphaerales bacterium]
MHTETDCKYGFRIVGPCSGERRLIDAAAAFNAYAVCDDRADVGKEAYLSAFWFGDDFRSHLIASGSTKGFTGVCWTPWLWWDIDNTGNVEQARIDAAKLANGLVEKYALDEDDLLIFFSGSKGFHVGLPTSIIANAAPSAIFSRIAKTFCQQWASATGITIDSGVYDQVRVFRAPNSRHPKTGLHKRQVTLATLMELNASTIAKLAENPEVFEIPGTTASTKSDWNPSADWNAAADLVRQQDEAKQQRREAVAAGSTAATLNRLTLNFIRDGAAQGDRHRLLYSAARNLAEFGCPPPLAHALLTEAALDTGLPPKEVHRQIECGLSDGGLTR